MHLNRGSEFFNSEYKVPASPRRDFLSGMQSRTPYIHPSKMPDKAFLAVGLLAMVQLSDQTIVPDKVTPPEKASGRCTVTLCCTIKSEILEVLPKINYEILEVQQSAT